MKNFHTDYGVPLFGVTSFSFEESYVNTLSWGHTDTRSPQKGPKPEHQMIRNFANFLSALLQIAVIVAILL